VSHLATWDEIRRLLREARNDVPCQGVAEVASPVPVGLLTGTLDEFEEFLEHNEFELAWDALANVAERVNAPPGCWRTLARAAALMQIPDKERAATRHVPSFVSCDRALAIAHADAEKAYRDLSGYRITISLEPDGWHIDYEVKDPKWHGGGPHYIIDPADGRILAKRYEQ
jgi:hypothetical protein